LALEQQRLTQLSPQMVQQLELARPVRPLTPGSIGIPLPSGQALTAQAYRMVYSRAVDGGEHGGIRAIDRYKKAFFSWEKKSHN
jgi:pectin methylesterase-like acyl-CoA thioesterase